ncbi:MAG: serine/threonine-protein kinase [Thermoanaerobaculia bacterium]
MPRKRSAAHSAGARFCSRCPAIFPPLTDLCPDDCVSLGFRDIPHVVAGKYRVEQRLGRGGTSDVYLARDLSLGRLVALKTLRRATPESIEMLRQEACATAALLHPHVAVLFGVETWHETPILVFEYLESGTLTERIAREAIPVCSVVEWGIGLAGSLEAAHVRGILHGDVKPANVGFNAVGTPKLLDFGLASALRPHEELSRARRLSPHSISGASVSRFTRRSRALTHIARPRSTRCLNESSERRFRIRAIFGRVAATSSPAFCGRRSRDVAPGGRRPLGSFVRGSKRCASGDEKGRAGRPSVDFAAILISRTRARGRTGRRRRAPRSPLGCWLPSSETRR